MLKNIDAENSDVSTDSDFERRAHSKKKTSRRGEREEGKYNSLSFVVKKRNKNTPNSQTNLMHRYFKFPLSVFM